MSFLPKNWIAFAGAVVVSVLTISVIAIWLGDVHRDREHIVAVKGPTPLFRGTGERGGCDGEQARVLDGGVRLTVRRIRYLKTCATLDVILPDGGEEYIVLGVGNVQVDPPLTNP
jgi:hypothetical protein